MDLENCLKEVDPDQVHYAEIQDEKRNVLWNGRIPVSRDGFLQLLEKIGTIEKS